MFRDLFRRRAGNSANDVATADGLIVSGQAHEDAGRLEQACEHYRRATQVAPDHAAGHLNLGIALAAIGDTAAAERAYGAVLALEPGHAFGNYNLANLSYTQGNAAQAEARVRAALKTRPDFAQAHVLLSNILEEAGDTAGAVVALESALRLKADYAGAHFNYALLLYKLKRHGEARSAFESAITLDPTNVQAHVLLDTLLREQGFLAESLETTRRALALAPDRWDLKSRELFSLCFDEQIDAQAVFAGHRDFGAQLEKAIPTRFSHGPVSSRGRDRPLRIGFVSGDLYVHPVALFLIPLLEHLDRAAFQTVCYSCGSRVDHITQTLRGLTEKWVEAADLSDEQLADAIHADGIDILIDLSGHTGSSRLAVFAQKPAPVQATWLGYLNTTGLTRIDYRLCDDRTDPPETTSLHTERLMPLPWSQWCYQPFLEIEQAQAAPFESNGYVTFGSFNQPGKISPDMGRRWARILALTPGSRLLIAGVSSDDKRASIRGVMEQEGIGGERIHFEPRVELPGYYALYDRVDVALDTYPYGGGTTTFDALWMGVPVVTATGDLSVSRSAASIIGALGMEGWIAQEVDRYVETAVACAGRQNEIARLRRSLRAQLSASGFMDGPRFAADFGAALRRMWSAER